ncbi:MAG: hypothetical protein JSW70_07070 [Syntrophobacterales bacterium]|nr:MAG: hypothetical protein JSW70_07070 [Syntrophobacterales bacterium]
MEPRPPKRALGAVFIPFLALFLTACSLLPWLKSENQAHRKMKERALGDKEVFIIDGQEYVKVANSGEEKNPSGSRYQYIPVDEYLSKRGEFSGPQGQKAAGEEPLAQSEKETITQSNGLSITASGEKAEIPVPSSIELRRKIIIAAFDEGESDEHWGEMVAERLRDSLENQTDRILCLDDQAILDYLNRRGIGSIRLDDPMIVRIANTVFGVHALLYGTLSGPYVAASKGKGGDGEDTALAIVRIQAKLIEAATGRVMKVFEQRNPIFAAEQKGEFSRDKARLKAIQLAIEELTGDILSGINQMVWYTRIVKIDGDRVYLNAGRLTGLKVGDLMDVYGSGGGRNDQMVEISMNPFEGQRKGQVRVSQLFGTDAAIAHITNGGNFVLSDVARPTTY